MALKLALIHALIKGDASSYVDATKKAKAATNDFTVSTKKAGASTSKTFGGISKFVNSGQGHELTRQFSSIGQSMTNVRGPAAAVGPLLTNIGIAAGGLGVAVGVVASVALPMLISRLVETETQAERFKNAMETLQGITSELARLNKIASSSIEELTEKYGRYAESVRIAAIELRKFEIDKLNVAYHEQLDLVDKLVVRYASLSDHVGEYDRNAVAKLMRDLGIIESQAENLSVLFARFMNATSQAAKDQALFDIHKKLEEMGVPIAKYPEDLKTAVTQMLRLLKQTAQTTTEAERLGTAFSNIKIPTFSFGAGVGGMGTDPTLLNQQFIGTFGGTTPPKPAGGGGGKSQKEIFEEQVDRLKEQLMTEAELMIKHYEDQQLMLDEALAAKAISQTEHYALMEQLAQDHNAKMSALDAYRYGDGTQKMAAFMGDMASAFSKGNEKMMQIGKAFGAAEALINAWRAYSQTMADPRLPWFAKFAAAMNVMTTTMQAVQAIKGIGKGGSGQKTPSGGRGRAGTIEGGPAQAPAMQRSLTLIGDNFNRAQAVQIAEFLNEGSDNGLVVRGR